MSEQQWPPYRVGHPDYIHALGVIASVYSLLEFRFRSLFALYLGGPPKLAYTAFAKMNNESRLTRLHKEVELSTHPEEIKDNVRFFLDGFNVCADNRNIFMHATLMFLFGPSEERCPELSPPDQPQGLAFQKAPKGEPFHINTYQLSVEEIRGHADAFHDFEVYGDRLYWHVLKNYEPARYASWRFPDEARFALPPRPALPNPLTPE